MPGDLAHDTARPNIGEATLYDIYYDDTDYDYMQHLRQIGDHADGVDSILLEAPSRTKKNKDKGEAIELRAAADIPAEALPSRIELAHTYESQLEIPSEIEGFRPDMDPHLRQVLEALEDDAFVDDDLANDFFDELVVDGERAPEDDIEFEFREEGFPEGVDEAVDEPNEPGDDEGWEARFANFKKNQQAAPRRDDGSIILSEGADTVGNIPQFSVVGGKKRGTGGSDATGYSMSSSALFRNKGLSLLDDQFDRVRL